MNATGVALTVPPVAVTAAPMSFSTTSLERGIKVNPQTPEALASATADTSDACALEMRINLAAVIAASVTATSGPRV